MTIVLIEACMYMSQAEGMLIWTSTWTQWQHHCCGETKGR